MCLCICIFAVGFVDFLLSYGFSRLFHDVNAFGIFARLSVAVVVENVVGIVVVFCDDSALEVFYLGGLWVSHVVSGPLNVDVIAGLWAFAAAFAVGFLYQNPINK